MQEIHKLHELIPTDELYEKLTYGYSELEPNFLCFEENYYLLSQVLPKHLTVVDCGCYQAAQCYFFRDFNRYIGVDCYDMREPSEDYIPPKRFKTENTVHLRMTIQQFIELNLKWIDMDKTFFIANAVPDFKATDRLFETVKNCFVAYPMEDAKVKGKYTREILEAIH